VVDVRGVRGKRARDFGEAFLGLALWRRLGLHTLLAELIGPGREDVPWPTVASVLAVARVGGQRFGTGRRRALVGAQRDGGLARRVVGEGE
jgi:hypothetical protein